MQLWPILVRDVREKLNYSASLSLSVNLPHYLQYTQVDSHLKPSSTIRSVLSAKLDWEPTRQKLIGSWRNETSDHILWPRIETIRKFDKENGREWNEVEWTGVNDSQVVTLSLNLEPEKKRKVWLTDLKAMLKAFICRWSFS